jgi:uncharacterized membrane protein YphA (DoxX/SURF4 family)
MNKSSYHILRVGLAVTFLWVGILIAKNPLDWGSFIEPWAAGFLPGSLHSAMVATAVMDIVVGFLLLIDFWTWLAALVAAFHLVVVLVVTGIGNVTVRDIGLLAGMLALMADSRPPSFLARLKSRKYA